MYLLFVSLAPFSRSAYADKAQSVRAYNYREGTYTFALRSADAADIKVRSLPSIHRALRHGSSAIRALSSSALMMSETGIDAHSSSGINAWRMYTFMTSSVSMSGVGMSSGGPAVR